MADGKRMSRWCVRPGDELMTFDDFLGQSELWERWTTPDDKAASDQFAQVGREFVEGCLGRELRVEVLDALYYFAAWIDLVEVEVENDDGPGDVDAMSWVFRSLFLWAKAAKDRSVFDSIEHGLRAEGPPRRSVGWLDSLYSKGSRFFRGQD